MLLALKFTVPKLYRFNNTKVNPPQAYVTVLVYLLTKICNFILFNLLTMNMRGIPETVSTFLPPPPPPSEFVFTS